ncbi:hypothetical protein Agabi119p4_4561 [Agaricus bisporus var. burnettii]|uniref:WW domain-containing protein n=1 Tax=Agaricus bisporus var. burnettii TaxID=192524 RepID=A0A8H7F3N9_AGABI|nr:hypothetical protein Agabi119p4_4561 [Agaricus bisporus var. burnettii]
MSVPPPFPLAVPPLPPPWSEHPAPGGRTYYYNNQTLQSTYARPVPSFHTMLQANYIGKKEKPLLKKQIPGTEWLCVKTNLGNIFYFSKSKRESVWSAPDSVVDSLRVMKRQEEEEEQNARQEMLDKATRSDEAKQKEIDRIKNELKGTVKRKADEETPLHELVIAKKSRVDNEKNDDDSEEDEEEDEEEEWQREAAAQLAAEAEEERRRQGEERKREEAEKQQQRELEAEAQRAEATRSINMPAKVDLSIEEAKALFKTLLREKDINPLHPWDASLPKFVNDPRYVLLPSVAARREAFDEFCRDRARELRELSVKQDKQSLDPKTEFCRLLEQEVKSTRTSWSDFRKTWKKDRRFYGWGRDDREREKRFREFLKDLGEKKRTAAQKAEAGFFLLLTEHKADIHEGTVWKEVKNYLAHDPRYDAIGSSSLREELFNTFLKGDTAKLCLGDKDETVSAQATVFTKKEKKERAVREREQKIKAELSLVEKNIEQSRMDINQEEGEREYKSMLTDALRDPRMTWNDALPQLKTDPRFRNSPLSPNQQLQLFRSHIEHLHQKHMANLHGLFQSHSLSLATPFTELPFESLLKSLPATKLGLNIEQLEHEYDKWQRERTASAKIAFNEMLAENSFIEFWGRLTKIGGEGVEGGVKADDIGDDEGEGGGGKVDMKALAKKVDLEEMEKVLKNDKRYMTFDHIPEQREKWLREYIANLAAPKLSVHVR